jgi:hypothetical protein
VAGNVFAFLGATLFPRPGSKRPVYHQGEPCPVCKKPVGGIVYGPAQPLPGGFSLLGGPTTQATLMPCQHRMAHVVAPGRERRRRT